MKRDGSLCMHAAFCVGRLERIPAMMEGVEDSDVRAAIIGMIERCPSGSYMFALDAGRRRRRARPTRSHRGHRGGGRARRARSGSRAAIPVRAVGRPAVRDAEPRHALPLRPVARQAAVRRHAPGDRLPRAVRNGPAAARRRARRALILPPAPSAGPARTCGSIGTHLAQIRDRAVTGFALA